MLNNKSILITGGTGSFGKMFTKLILKNYPDVKRLVILSRDEQKHYQKYHVVFDSINANLSANHSIASLAKKMHMSQSNFAKCFRRDTGFSPKAYLNKRLIEEAQHQLISNTHSIATIAYHLKFEDEHYFSRFFKKNTGFSPSDYRKHHHDIK